MSTDIDVRYRQWEQKMNKLEIDLAELQGSITDDDYTLKPFDVSVEDRLEFLSATTKQMRIELEDLIIDEEVEDFLQNGPGIRVDNGK